MSSNIGKRSAPQIRDYFKRYWRTFTIGIVCLIITQSFALSAPQLLRIATDAIIAVDTDTVVKAALALIGVAIFGSIARVSSRILIFNGGRSVEFDLRNDAFDHLQRLQPSFYAQMPLGQVMSRMVNDMTQVRLLLGPGLLNIINTTLVYLVVLPLLFLTDWKLTLYCMAPMPVLIFLARRFGKLMYVYNREAQERLGTLSAKVQENLSGVMTVRAYRQEKREEEAFNQLNNRYLASNIKLAKLRGTFFPMMGLAGAIGSIIVLYVGGMRIVSGEMSVGQFVQFNAYLAALTWPTMALGWLIAMWQRGLAAMDRINEIIETEPTIVDGPEDPAELVGRIEIKDLTFRYEEGAALALDNVNATFAPGETIVIVGRTGSGKTTLLKAIARLLEIPSGSIYLDGQDVLDLPLSHVRGALGYAPQDAFLFSRTLFENVAFGAPKTENNEVEEAVSIAQMEPDLAGFPEGLSTVVGERGVTLSGGQRQRTTLARALLVSPKVLLLDDTMSAVDAETETLILDRLCQKDESRIMIVATHRLALAATADRILVLDNGQLVEQGTERELLELGGIYAAMHRRQRARQAIEAQVTGDLVIVGGAP